MSKYRIASSTFTVDIILQITNSGATPVSSVKQMEEILDRDPDAQFVTETATFAYWDYSLKTKIEIEATMVSAETQMHYINPIKKRQLKWLYLLRHWSLTEENDVPIVVAYDAVNKRLTDEFMHTVLCGPNAINPVILDAFISKADMILEWGMSEEDVKSTNPKAPIRKKSIKTKGATS